MAYITDMDEFISRSWETSVAAWFGPDSLELLTYQTATLEYRRRYFEFWFLAPAEPVDPPSTPLLAHLFAE